MHIYAHLKPYLINVFRTPCRRFRHGVVKVFPGLLLLLLLFIDASGKSGDRRDIVDAVAVVVVDVVAAVIERHWRLYGVWEGGTMLQEAAPTTGRRTWWSRKRLLTGAW